MFVSANVTWLPPIWILAAAYRFFTHYRFDERKSDCGLTVEKLGFAPVIAVVAAIFCALLAASHTMLRCLPPLANSFFIFNANEDNRLCIDPVFKSPGDRTQSIEKVKRTSLIPVRIVRVFLRLIVAINIYIIYVSVSSLNANDFGYQSVCVMVALLNFERV